MNIFGTPKQVVDPLEQAKEWKRHMSREQRSMERDIVRIKKEESKAMAECKKLAKSGNISAVKIIAKEIVRTRKSVERMTLLKTQMHSVELTMMKVQGCLAKSTEVMQAMNKLMRVPELSKTMTDMAREMERAGLIEEIISDTFAMMDDDGIEDAADAEVEQIVAAALAGVLTSGAAPKSEVAVEGKEEELGEDMSDIRSRLEALK